MTEEIKKDPLDDEILNFSFTVAQTNRFLELLANAPLPFVATAPLIELINKQGEPQFRELLQKLQKDQNEPKATT
jgi:hypothetical protein